MALFAFYNQCRDPSDGDNGSNLSAFGAPASIAELPLPPQPAVSRDSFCPDRDPFRTGAISSADQIFPFFAVNELPAGLPGLVIAGVMAATMSTISSGLSSLTTVVVTDFLQPAGWLPPAGSPALLKCCKALTIVGAGLVMWMASLFSVWGAAITEMSSVTSSATGGPLLGLFLLGLLTTRATAKGAAIGVFFSSASMAVIMLNAAACGDRQCEPQTIFGEPPPDVECCGWAAGALARVTIWWYPAIGAVLTFVVGFLCSQPSPQHEQRLITRRLVVVRGLQATGRELMDSRDASTKAGSDETVSLTSTMAAE
eukprot:SAG31_NODE_3715_length_3955_cov_10.723288_2_plen_313_part_00